MNMKEIRRLLFQGMAIPAIPLALHEDGTFDPLHQRALLRYYIDSGVGGIAAAVHTTQFEIRERPDFFRDFLTFVSGEISSYAAKKGRQILKIGGVCGNTKAAVSEAGLLREKGFDLGLLSLATFKGKSPDSILEHCRKVAKEIPLFGFYLQPAVGGIPLSRDFWKDFASIPNVLGIKVAPFNRYKTLDVVQGVSEAGCGHEVALYTGNDDSIIFDLLSSYPCSGEEGRALRFSGGLLGHWCVWTSKAVELLEEIKKLRAKGSDIPFELLERAQKITDANAAIFDAQNDFAGVIPGVHEILRRQGLLESRRCLDPSLELSPSQMGEIERVIGAYPELQDDAFISLHIDQWLTN
jgi:dihydrodipicolinate synthase/N-acetylneuraminate lyase